MSRVRWSLVAGMLTVLGCGGTKPVVGGESDLDMEDDEPATALDAGTGSGQNSSRKDASVRKPTTPDESPVSMDRPKEGEQENCGQESFRTGPVTPDILIVLDRSGSMRPGDGAAMLRCNGMPDIITQLACVAAGIDCNSDRDRNTVQCGGMETRVIDRWAPSVAAIKKLTMDFNEDIAFGLLTFPGQNGGGRNGGCTPGSMQVPIGLNKAAAISMVLDATQPQGGTPTGQALQSALEEFRKQQASDTVMPARYVVLVTDGQPTCPNAQGGMGGGGNALMADKKLTLDALDALNKEGIKTFVIGYDAALDPQFSMALTEFAQHGGTEKYYAVQDEMSLNEAFKTISSAVIKCEATLSSSFVRPEDIHVKLDGNELPLNDPNGWRIEQQTVFIEGEACSTLQSGRGHKIEVVVDCQRLE